ncbi:N-acetylneuraminate synthase family protein [SAR86 cluster bacterium]|nr:N-acetylneuraminate synthase family protein [SAR86 cluster bacterium]
MKIKHRNIGQGNPPLIIAELGINHGGSLDVAKKMVLAAKKSGCEIIKHQTHILEDEMTDEAKSIFPPNADKSIWDVISECILTKEEEVKLKDFTESQGLIYISTPFSRAAADFLQSIDVPAFKIGSGECDNLPLLKHIASFGKPIIMSTGMQSIDSLRRSVEILDSSNIRYALLECTNLYPSPPENVSLQGIALLRENFPNAVIGFSDHSIGPSMALASVACGASIIERHFTDSMYREGPDIAASMNPSELSFLIEKSKEIFIASQNIKNRTKEEEDVYRFARASVVADKEIKAGDEITYENIWVRRPGNGEIPPWDYEKIIGKKAKNNIKHNQQIKYSDLI